MPCLRVLAVLRSDPTMDDDEARAERQFLRPINPDPVTALAKGGTMKKVVITEHDPTVGMRCDNCAKPKSDNTTPNYYGTTVSARRSNRGPVECPNCGQPLREVYRVSIEKD